MVKSKLEILQQELRDRRLMLKEDINDIQSGDEYNPQIYREVELELKFLDKILNRIWDIKNNNI